MYLIRTEQKKKTRSRKRNELEHAGIKINIQQQKID